MLYYAVYQKILRKLGEIEMADKPKQKSEGRTYGVFGAQNTIAQICKISSIFVFIVPMFAGIGICIDNYGKFDIMFMLPIFAGSFLSSLLFLAIGEIINQMTISKNIAEESYELLKQLSELEE